VIAFKDELLLEAGLLLSETQSGAMNKSKTKTNPFSCWNRLVSVATVLLGAVLLSIDRKVVQHHLGCDRNDASDASGDSNTNHPENASRKRAIRTDFHNRRHIVSWRR